ncbi:MAG: hypothetical protein IPJ71_01685 [Bdellovibrionales bacterium]|nr:hypothetical protein [Bdellovibrionales bacterium]
MKILDWRTSLVPFWQGRPIIIADKAKCKSFSCFALLDYLKFLSVSFFSSSVLFAIVFFFAMNLTFIAWAESSEGISSLVFEDHSFSRFHGKWNIEAGGETFSEGVDQGTLVGFVFRSRVQYRLTDQIDLYVDAKMQMLTRQIQARFADSRQTGIFPYEVVARYRPSEKVELKAGALNMGFLDLPLLISKERSFPGAFEKIGFGEGKNYLRAVAQQSIPTSSSFESMRSEKEETPLFTTESLQAGSSLGEVMIVSGQLTHFRYSDLPSVVAFESGKMGNTTTGEFPANSRFLFGFSGWVVGGEFCLCRSPGSGFRIGGYQLENREAEPAFNRSQELVLRGDFEISEFVLSPYLLRFFSESDAVPAFFNSGSRGHNNRRGEGLGMEIFFRPYNFRLVGEYISSDVINPNSLQQRLNSIQVRLETLNVEF